jgi:hypothetical protein
MLDDADADAVRSSGGEPFCRHCRQLREFTARREKIATPETAARDESVR